MWNEEGSNLALLYMDILLSTFLKYRNSSVPVCKLCPLFSSDSSSTSWTFPPLTEQLVNVWPRERPQVPASPDAGEVPVAKYFKCYTYVLVCVVTHSRGW